MKKNTIDDYVYYKDIVLCEFIEDAEDEKEEAEEISGIIESKMMDGGGREHFLKHLIKSDMVVDELNEEIEYLESKRVIR